jgi:hypothetical protein
MEKARARPHIARRRLWLFRLSALVLSIAAASLVAEVGLRLAGYGRRYANPVSSFHEPDDVACYRGKPHFVGRFKKRGFDVVIAHDEWGFRRQEHQREPASGANHVFVLGDSYTWGWGVAQGRVFTDQMSLHMPGHRVHNLGLSASGTVQQFAVFDRHVRDRLQPGNIVVVAFVGNDFSDNVNACLRGEVVDGEVRTVGPVQIESELKDRLKDSSYLFNLLAFTVDRAKARWRQREGARRVILGDGKHELPRLADDSPEIVVTRHYLAKLKKACEEKGARLTVVSISWDTQLLELTESLAIETLDMIPRLEAAREAGEIGEWTLPHDSHWNEAGHALAGKLIAEWLVTRG